MLYFDGKGTHSFDFKIHAILSNLCLNFIISLIFCIYVSMCEAKCSYFCLDGV